MRPNCDDHYWIATHGMFHSETFRQVGTYTIKFFDLTAKIMNEIDAIGIAIFRFCNSAEQFLPSLLKTLELFVGEEDLFSSTGNYGKGLPQWR